MIAEAISYPIGVFDLVEGNGVSYEAHRLRYLFSETREQLWSSAYLGASREECLNQLLEIWMEANSAGWDGNGANCLDFRAANSAVTFINAVPNNIPMPEVAADPDGEVSFDWFVAPRRQFSISLGARGVLSYAGLFGSDKVSGSERFQGTIPRNLLDYIRRVAR